MNRYPFNIVSVIETETDVILELAEYKYCPYCGSKIWEYRYEEHISKERFMNFKKRINEDLKKIFD